MILRIIVLATLLAVSQSMAAMPKSPSAALKEIRKQYKAIKSFRCDFTEQFQWQFTGELVTREGTMITGSGERFRMQTPEQVIVCDGENLYRYNLLKKQVMIEPLQEASNLLPRRFLLDLGDEFDAVSINPVAVDGREGFRLDLIPLKPEESFMSNATVWVTLSDMIVHKMQMDDLNGNRTTYILQNIRIDTPIDIGETSFTIPEGVELFDLR